MSALFFACYFRWLMSKLWLWSDECNWNEWRDCHRYRAIAEKIGSKSWRGSTITTKVTSRLNTYLISQLLDFIPLIIQELRGIGSTLDCSDLPIKLISKLLGISYTGETDNRKLRCPPRNMSKSSIIEQVVFNRAAITSNLHVSRKKEIVYCERYSIRKRSRSPSLVPPSFADIVGFLSQDCALLIVRPLSPYSDLGHFDVRSMRLTYWPICTVMGCWDVVEG